MHTGAARVCCGESSELLLTYLPMLAPCKLPFVSDHDTAGIIRGSLGILPRPLYVTALCLTGDWYSLTLQSPPLHINYLSLPQIFTSELQAFTVLLRK